MITAHAAPEPPLLSTSLVTSTTFTLSWRLPASVPQVRRWYRVKLSRVTGSDDVDSLCSAADNKSQISTTGTSLPFSSLQEFSTYIISFNTEYNIQGSPVFVQTTMNIQTLSSGMCGYIPPCTCLKGYLLHC